MAITAKPGKLANGAGSCPLIRYQDIFLTICLNACFLYWCQRGAKAEGSGGGGEI